MLLTTLLSQHPEAALDIVRGTPAWVAALLAALIALGFSSTRARTAAPARLALLPMAMLGLALWGVQSAFATSGRLAELMLLWAACFAAMLALSLRGAAPAGTRWIAAERRFHLPGSWAPMALIVGVFLIKYTVGVQLALEPALTHHAGFAFAITGLYGLMSGWIAARTLRVLRLQKPAAPLVIA